MGLHVQDFHEPIRIIPRNAAALQENCLRCHGEFVHSITGPDADAAPAADAVRCVHCHADVGHGPRAGLGR